jgi:predicted anti-sigma-YlaC factor YlaD
MNRDSDTSTRVQPRLVMCPKCRQRFETMRRFQMACTACGYEWEEESKLSAGDKFERFRTDAGEYLFMWACWAGMGALVLMVASIFVIGFLRLVERRGVGTALPLVLVAIVVIAVVAAVFRPIFETQERMMFWRMGWRGGKNDPKDYRDR